MARTLDATVAALWEEALDALAEGQQPEWVPDEGWRQARRVASEVTEGWVGSRLGFLEDIAFIQAVRLCSTPS